MHCVSTFLIALRLCQKNNPGRVDRGYFFKSLFIGNTHARCSGRKEDN